MLAPFNLQQWIDENRAKLQPPVCNKQVFEMGDFIIMAVGGPNNRKDFHDDAGEEFFYQLQGHMTLRIMENGRPREITIGEGEVFLLPAHVPHSPQRYANTVGLVIERRRRPDEKDGFLWFCEQCHGKIHEEYIPLANIENDLPLVFQRFWADESLRTCGQCGSVMQPPAVA